MNSPDDQRRRDPSYVAVALVGALIGAVVTYYLPGLFQEVGSALRTETPVRADITTEYLSTWVSPVPVDQLGTPPAPCDTKQYARWMAGKGAIRARRNEVFLTLTSLTEASTLIEGLVIHRKTQMPPIEGTYVGCGAGGPIGVRHLLVNLDVDPPTVTYRDDRGNEADRFFFSLAKGETEVLAIIATTESYSQVWSGELLLRVNGEELRIPVLDNYTADFEVSAVVPGRDLMRYNTRTTVWERFATT